MKTVYYCTGGCKGESDTSGVCGTDGCTKHNKPLIKSFKCGACGLHYEDEKLAKKCESWCSEHPNSCGDFSSEALESKTNIVDK